MSGTAYPFRLQTHSLPFLLPAFDRAGLSVTGHGFDIL